MACRRQFEQELVPADHTYTCYIDKSSAQTGTVQEYYCRPQVEIIQEQHNHWRGQQPSAPPTHWQAGAAAVVTSLEEAGQAAAQYAMKMGGNVQVLLVNNMQVHVHQQEMSKMKAAVSESDTPAAGARKLEDEFRANDPVFQPCSYSPQGLDFGRKVLSRRYKAQKHVHSAYSNIITYTQCASTAQAISHAATFYLSRKRSKHAIFLFDCDHVDEIGTSAWPPTIYFKEICSLIQQLGPDCEYHRRKVKNERFSLYFYVVKKVGVRFSERGHRAWSSLFQWATSLRDSPIDSPKSDLTSAQVIAQVAGIGLGILGVL